MKLVPSLSFDKCRDVALQFALRELIAGYNPGEYVTADPEVTMLLFQISARNHLRSALFTLAVFASAVFSAPAQGNSADSRYISFSPANPVSTEPFTVTENSPNVPDGTTVTIHFSTVPNPPLVPGGSNPYLNQVCTLTQTNGSASCLIGRLLPGNYQLYAFASTNSGTSLNAQPTFSVAAPGANAASALQGQYAFLVTSASTGNGAKPDAAAAAGSFTADGHGNITAGIVDVNTAGLTLSGASVTGTYQLDSTGKGAVSLSTPQGVLSFGLFVPAKQVVTNVVSGSLVTTSGGLITGGGTLAGQSGILQSSKPVSPGFPSAFNGLYEFRMSGETGSKAYAIGGAGQLSFTSAGTVVGKGQLTVNGAGVDFSGLSGTYEAVDSTTGRAMMTLAAPGQPVTTYAVYETAQQSLYFLSLTPHAESTLYWGTGTAN